MHNHIKEEQVKHIIKWLIVQTKLNSIEKVTRIKWHEKYFLKQGVSEKKVQLFLKKQIWVNAFFSYHKNLEYNKNFCQHIVKIENILKLWHLRQLTLEGRVTVSKSFAVSKLIHILLITTLHNKTLDLLYKIQKNFVWQGQRQKLNTVLFAVAMKREV